MQDLISRQAAVELIHTLYPSAPIIRRNRERWEERYKPYIEAEKALEQLPSAEPELNFDEWCTDCKEYDHEKHCCPRWNRVIRQTLKDAQPEIVHCKDCKHRGEKPISDGRYWCNIHSYFMYYCSDAERRTDGSD